VVVPEVVDVVVNQVAEVSAAMDEIVADEIAATETVGEDVQAEAQATPVVVLAHVVAAPAQAIEASTDRTSDAGAPDVTDGADNALGMTEPAPADVSLAQTLPVHDSWAVEPSAAPIVSAAVSSAQIAAEDVDAGAPQQPMLAEPIAQPSTWASLGAPSDERTAAISISAEQLSWAGIGRSPAGWTAHALSTPVADDSAHDAPIIPDNEQPFSAVPAGIGLSTSVAAGWLPSFSGVAVSHTWRPWSLTAMAGRAVVVLPNLAPPG
jgi:hypothetical protein